MPKRIDKLTSKQEAQIPEWVRKWIANGLSTKPANFAEAERGIRGCYRAANLAEPQVILYCASPLAAVKEGPRVELLMNNPHATEQKIRKYVKDNWRSYRGGNMWSGWVAYVTFLTDVCDWTDCPEAFQWERLHVENAAWCWYGELVAAISDRPAEIHLDEDNRLHSETGPSIRYRDDWSQWHVHGVAVTEQIVMRPQTQTIHEILADSNEEVRRVRIERFGWGRFLLESGSKIIDQRRNDRDAQHEKLFQLKDGTRRFHCCDPSTGREYFLGVPREVKTCEEAQRWVSSGLDICAIHRS